MIANDRQHMAMLIEDRMGRPMAEAHRSGAADKAQVKTYLIEANLPEDSEPQTACAFVRELLPKVKHSRIGKLTLTPAKRDTLISIQADVGRHTLTAYLDFTNPRFWMMHSMGESDVLDWLTGRWISDLPELDRAWLPVSLLEKCKDFGALRGIGINFDKRWIDSGNEADRIPVDLLKMQLRGSQAGHLLDVMRKKDAAPHETTLSKVTIRIDGGKCVDEVKYDGKITGRGKSFDDHLALTGKLYDRYARQIRRIETDYAIRGEKKNKQVLIQGAPVAFAFDRAIPELEKFCEGVFSGAEPFKLWGVPVRVSDSYFTVEALDLHSGRTVSFELSPRLIRVYIPQGSCGNSVLRFYTHLQHHFDALVRAVGSDGEPVFEF